MTETKSGKITLGARSTVGFTGAAWAQFAVFCRFVISCTEQIINIADQYIYRVIYIRTCIHVFNDSEDEDIENIMDSNYP